MEHLGAGSAEIDKSVNDLAAKLESHKAQLAQVDQLLLQNPNDPTFLQLRDDLLKVVSLTEDLAGVQPNPGASSASLAAMSAPAKKWSAGDRANALWSDGVRYPARIDEVTLSGSYMVTFLTYGNKYECGAQDLQELAFLTRDQVKEGMTVLAQWRQDGLFYPAVIESFGAHGLIRVKYTGMTANNKGDVPLKDIMLRPKKRKKGKMEDLPDKPVIPEKLRWKASDTAKQKEIKKKKIKNIKNTHRKRKLEQKTNMRKDNWQKFLKGKKGGSYKGRFKKKKSMFAVPDDPDGKVGVIGSGRGMTKVEDMRRANINVAAAAAGVSMPELTAQSQASTQQLLLAQQAQAQAAAATTAPQAMTPQQQMQHQLQMQAAQVAQQQFQ